MRLKSERVSHLLPVLSQAACSSTVVFVLIAALCPFPLRAAQPLGIPYRGLQELLERPAISGFVSCVLILTVLSVLIRTLTPPSLPVICVSFLCWFSLRGQNLADQNILVGQWFVFLLAFMLRGKAPHAVLCILLVILTLHVTSGLILYCIGAHQFVTPGFGRRLSGLYENPDTFYPLAILSLAWSLTVGLSSRFTMKSLWFFLAGLSSVSIVLTFSRSAILGLSVVYALQSWRLSSGAGKVFMVCIACVCLLLSVFVRSPSSKFAFFSDRSARGRIAIWHYCILKIEQEPFGGFGLESFERLSTSEPGASLAGLGALPSESKNLFLNVLLDLGLPGLAALIVFAGATFKCASLRRSMPPYPWHERALDGIVTIAMPALLVCGVFDTPLFSDASRTPGSIAFMTLAGLCVGYRYRQSLVPAGLSACP